METSGSSKSGNRSPRISTRRRAQLERRLLAYAVGAAGLATLAQPAHAEIIFTPANQLLLGGFYPVDVDHDGVSDFSLHAYISAYYSSTYNDLLKVGAKGQASVIGLQKGNAVSAWDAPLNWSIGPNSPKPFVNIDNRSALMLAAGPKFNPPQGPWKNVTNRFLGLKLTINGETHYGWARLTVKTLHGVIDAKLTGYAYETIPDKPILAGDRGPADNVSSADTQEDGGPSLAGLSLGANGLQIWRREGVN